MPCTPVYQFAACYQLLVGLTPRMPAVPLRRWGWKAAEQQQQRQSGDR
jgi:hypothetical protein